MIDLNRLTMLETMQIADILVKTIISDVALASYSEHPFAVLLGDSRVSLGHSRDGLRARTVYTKVD
jgi:hypothetical protein